MKKVTSLYIIVSAIILFASCGKEPTYNYSDANAPAPAQVTDIKVIPTPGGGYITYTLPIDPNLSYVKAEYEIHPGEKSEAKTSRFKDTLNISGFGDVNPRTIKIYSVGKNEKASAALEVQLIPLTPPLISVFNTITLSPTFGGVRLNFQNPDTANLAMTLLYDSTGTGAWREVQTFYSSALAGAFAARGFDTTSQKFAVYVRDRWNNRSDTLEQSLKPLFEEFIPKTTWKALFLPTDTYDYVESFDLTHVYDGVWGVGNYNNIFATVHTAPIPEWFTLDLGVQVEFSRMKVMHFTESPFSGASVKIFEIWGSNDPPLDGSWNNWVQLSSFESVKPSGLPYGQVTDDDKNYAIVLGEDYDFPANISGSYRYIRFKTIATWGSAGPIGQVVIPEISFWGKVVH